LAFPGRPDQLAGERMQVRLVAGRDLQGGGLYLSEALAGKPATHSRRDPAARG
jgi:hypothetical protein